MHVHNVMPDRHTFVAALKACAQLGDVKTAFDILQELKIHGFPMTEHTYNELIRVYAGASLHEHVKEEHIDMYLKDSMELFKTLEKGENGTEVNIQVLNSLLLLYSNALRPEQLEAEVLPLYDKFKIKHDIYTYQNLSRMYLKLRDLDTIMVLWDKLRSKETFKANLMMLNTVLEAAIR